MDTLAAIDHALDKLCEDLPDLLGPVDPTGRRRVFECLADELRAVCPPGHREHLERRLVELWTRCRDGRVTAPH